MLLGEAAPEGQEYLGCGYKSSHRLVSSDPPAAAVTPSGEGQNLQDIRGTPASPPLHIQGDFVKRKPSKLPNWPSLHTKFYPESPGSLQSMGSSGST